MARSKAKRSTGRPTAPKALPPGPLPLAPPDSFVQLRATRREVPTHGRALATYKKLLKAAGEVLGEVGFERLTTNDICTRARVTPPALYHYFADKYDILEELGLGLLRRQNDAFFVWLFNGGAWARQQDRATALEAWFQRAFEVTTSEPGAMWTLRALRALPHLAHLRLQWQRMLTDQMFEIYRREYPQIEPQLLWRRLRIACELGSMVEELALEEERIPNTMLFREAARIASGLFDEERSTP